MFPRTRELTVLFVKQPTILKEDVKLKNEIVVRPTDNAEDVVEGGFNYLYEVVFCEVGEEEGKLTWGFHGFPSNPLCLPNLSEKDICRPPTKDIINHVRDMKIIGDDVISLLTEERGVRVIVLDKETDEFPDTCICPCHENDSKIEHGGNFSCCRPCPLCKRNIRSVIYNNHFKNCFSPP